MDRKRSRHPLPIPLSAVNGAVWPAPAGGKQAIALAALHEQDHGQYLPPQEPRRRKFMQAARLVAHAAKTAPFWRERFRRTGFAAADGRAGSSHDVAVCRLNGALYRYKAVPESERTSTSRFAQ